MRESIGIDSISVGPMPKPYSQDLRMRVIETVEGGIAARGGGALRDQPQCGGDLDAALDGDRQH